VNHETDNLEHCFSNCVPRTTGGTPLSEFVFGRKIIANVVSDTEGINLQPYTSVLKLPLLVDLQQKVGEFVLSITSCP
jgi:hypothetical protein